jgi:hypothetical protein
MENWNEIKENEPVKIYAKAYEFYVEIKSDRIDEHYEIIKAIWNGYDWYLIDFEGIPGYQDMSGIEFFKINKPKYWRVYKASNVEE